MAFLTLILLEEQEHQKSENYSNSSSSCRRHYSCPYLRTERRSKAVRTGYINCMAQGGQLQEEARLTNPFCSLLVHELGCVAFSVDYCYVINTTSGHARDLYSTSLAPEFPYLVPLEDWWKAI